jgi:hypothetical protein
MSQFTFSIDDPNNLVSSKLHQDIERCALYVIELVDRYIDWQGTLDFEVEIRPGSDLTWSEANGLLPTIGQLTWTGQYWNNDTVTESTTGVDSDPSRPDAGCTIYLGDDGTIRNYGYPVWFDPNPEFEKDPGVPSGYHDFLGIFTHEVFHSLGFYGATKQWQDLVVKERGNYYFTGQHVKDLLGEKMILQPWTGGDGTAPDHYGNTGDADNNVPRGLMFQWGNYETNRLDIGRIDLAVLADLGYDVDFDGLPLFELQDDDPRVNGTSASESLYGDYHSNVVDGKDGNDVLYGWSGKDRLIGGIGSDELHGGVGNDALVGGKGSDRFVFDTDLGASNVDTIAGLVRGSDKIVLNDDVFDLGVVGSDSGVPLPASAFRSGKSAADSDDHIIYDRKTGYLYFDPDGAGGEDQIQFATIGSNKIPALSAGDFLVI